MVKKIIFKVNPWRKQRGVLKPDAKPIARSKYASYLFQIGAGFNERKAD